VRRRNWFIGFTLWTFTGWAQLASPDAFAATTPDRSVEDRSETHFLPLFPLRIVAFPGEIVFLHIFEPRYKQLITESAYAGISFGIVTIVPGGGSSIGTEMKLDGILRTDDSGNMDIAVRGLRTFELKSFQRVVAGKLYSGGQVIFNTNDPRVEHETQDTLVQLYNGMQDATGDRKKIVAPYPENLSFVIGHDLGLSQAGELQLLTMPAERDRQQYLLQQLLGTQ
jgi:hypothetical protein